MSMNRKLRRLQRKSPRRSFDDNDRILRAAGHRYAQDGCARCGGHGSTSTAVVLPDGSPICVPCLAPGEKQRGIGTIHGIAAASDGQESDRLWFEKHPAAVWRLRAPLHMEREELLARDAYIELATTGDLKPTDRTGFNERTATHVFTYQVAPGQRIRRLCTPPCADDQVERWAEEIVLPAVKAMAARAMQSNLAMTPDFRALATNAASILQTPGGLRFAAEALAQGKAIRESRKETRQ